jgi:hypothetical protein
MLDAAGITVTDAARARAKLREMDERMTPKRWALLRESLGLAADVA